MNDDDSKLYDQEYDAWCDQWQNAIGPETKAHMQRALVNEQLLMWEHELSQPDYYNYYLEEMTR